MSLVIAVGWLSGVVLACDSFIGNTCERDVYAGDKFHEFPTGLALGYVGNLGFIRRATVLDPPPANAAELAAAVADFPARPEGRTAFVCVNPDGELTQVDPDGSLFSLQADRMIAGGDQEIARGALEAGLLARGLIDRAGAPCKDASAGKVRAAVKAALSVAAACGQYTRAPFHFRHFKREW